MADGVGGRPRGRGGRVRAKWEVVVARLAELYQTHSASVRTRCRGILKDAVAAEDATQETYLRVQRHLAEVEGVDDVGAWILRIATNYCLNELRNRALARDRSQKLEELARTSPEDSLLARDLLRKLLRDLPETLQTLLSLHYFCGLEQGHIAGRLGVSRRTVVSRMADLRDTLERWENV